MKHERPESPCAKTFDEVAEQDEHYTEYLLRAASALAKHLATMAAPPADFQRTDQTAL
jgi:hypothetical protein